MCRWVVYKGRRVCLADIITRPRHSLVKMSFEHYMPHIESNWNLSKLSSTKKRNHDVNADGFGIGWYDRDVDEDPCIFSSVNPAEHNRNLQRLASKIHSPLIFAHVRAASPGSPVVETNCHPFQFGRFMFMHNGGVANFSKIKRQLLARLSLASYSLIQGTTDSEHAAALFIDCLPGQNMHGDYTSDQIKEALRQTVAVLVHLSNEVEQAEKAASSDSGLHAVSSSAADHVASSLNFAVSDGRTVVATRFRDHVEEHPPSLYICKATDIRLQDKEVVIDSCTNDSTLSAAVIIASEPLTYDEKCWKLIPRNSIVTVKDNNEVSIDDLQVEVCPNARHAFKVWKKRALEQDVIGKPLLASTDVVSPPDAKRPKLFESSSSTSTDTVQPQQIDFSSAAPQSTSSSM